MRDVGATGPAGPVVSGSGARREAKVVVLLPTTAPPYTTPEELEQYRRLQRIVDEMNAVKQSPGSMAGPASPVFSGVSGATGPGGPPAPSSGPNEFFDIDIIGADGAMGPQFGSIVINEPGSAISPLDMRCACCGTTLTRHNARCFDCGGTLAQAAHDVGYQQAADEFFSKRRPS